MADTPKHSVSVAGIVVDDEDRVLVIQRRDNGHWEPPGGVLELDETPEDGVVREILEETGVLVEVDRLTGVYKNVKRHVVALVFRCHQVGGALKTSDESRKVEWRSYSTIELEMDEAYAVRIADAIGGDVEVRSHDGIRLLSKSRHVS